MAAPSAVTSSDVIPDPTSRRSRPIARFQFPSSSTWGRSASRRLTTASWTRVRCQTSQAIEFSPAGRARTCSSVSPLNSSATNPSCTASKRSMKSSRASIARCLLGIGAGRSEPTAALDRRSVRRLRLRLDLVLGNFCAGALRLSRDFCLRGFRGRRRLLLLGEAGGALPELAHRLAERAGQLGKLLGPEEEDAERESDPKVLRS